MVWILYCCSFVTRISDHTYRALLSCAIASMSTPIPQSGYETIATICLGIQVMNFSREIDYILEETLINLSSLEKSNVREVDGPYHVAQDSAEPSRIFKTSSSLTSGPIQANKPCPARMNCTYTIPLQYVACGYEEKDNFGGHNPQFDKPDLLPSGNLLYAI